jgi:transcriptional regulator
MYSLPYFTEPDPEKVFAFMQENPFVLLIGSGADFPVATQVPVEIDQREDGSIRFIGHMMKGTDHHKAFLNNSNVLVVFTGPHCYISASWYNTPNIASTWNYISVHAKGKISFTDEQGTLEVIKSVTRKYEAASDNPSLVEAMPADYVTRNLKAISGFEIHVQEIQNVFKLSQNRDEESQRQIINKLKERGDHHSLSIAAEMEKRLS